MDMNVELKKGEVKTAIRRYLREEEGLAVNESDISFNVRRGTSGGRPGSLSSPNLKSVECDNVEKIEDSDGTDLSFPNQSHEDN